MRQYRVVAAIVPLASWTSQKRVYPETKTKTFLALQKPHRLVGRAVEWSLSLIPQAIMKFTAVFKLSVLGLVSNVADQLGTVIGHPTPGMKLQVHKG